MCKDLVLPDGLRLKLGDVRVAKHQVLLSFHIQLTRFIMYIINLMSVLNSRGVLHIYACHLYYLHIIHRHKQALLTFKYGSLSTS